MDKRKARTKGKNRKLCLSLGKFKDIEITPKEKA